MTDKLKIKGDFTLPGEAGYEELTLELAERWGADAIRDSDGTVLSDKIIKADYPIYSTICLIRADNEWAKANRDKLQQNYLMSDPVIAETSTITIDLLKGFYREQFEVNANDNPKEWWQVFDRTTGEEIQKDLTLIAGCIGGAESVENIEQILQDIGFKEIKIQPKDESKTFIGKWMPDMKLEDYIVSASIEAIKPMNSNN